MSHNVVESDSTNTESVGDSLLGLHRARVASTANQTSSTGASPQCVVPVTERQIDSAQFGPLVRGLPEEWTPEYCFERLSRMRGCVWLDSSMTLERLGRYSYLSADPFMMLRVDQVQPQSLATVDHMLAKYYQPKDPHLPPFQGGWMGWFAYELGRCFETIPAPRHNEFSHPLVQLGMYDVVLAWDHKTGQGWLVSQGWPERTPKKRERRAYQRILQFLALLEADDPSQIKSVPNAGYTWRVPPKSLARQFPTRWSPSWTSDFSSAGFREAVARGVQYVHAGDIFQVNLAQRLLHPMTSNSADLYVHLRRQNPAPFAGYADLGRVQVISSSPERFLQVHDGIVETRPIKGTRPRMSDPMADHGISELLRVSPKDRSENVMIVDLLRNDLSRVAHPDSVQVTQLCQLEAYRYVWHLVSAVQGTLLPETRASEVLRATFPGGSITGAPKVRAMEIIAELEPTTRGPYCGSLGYLSCAGDMDLNILIRTVTACDGWWQVHVGGGIVADSDPMLEEQETWHKAEGVLRAIDSVQRSSS